jgi:hypothetical protein
MHFTCSITTYLKLLQIRVFGSTISVNFADTSDLAPALVGMGRVQHNKPFEKEEEQYKSAMLENNQFAVFRSTR